MIAMGGKRESGVWKEKRLRKPLPEGSGLVVE
jgi:hypothetical protein